MDALDFLAQEVIIIVECKVQGHALHMFNKLPIQSTHTIHMFNIGSIRSNCRGGRETVSAVNV